MMRSSQLNLAQRTVLVVGWGAALVFGGSYLTSLGTPHGWVAYAPLSNSTLAPSPFGLHAWPRLLIWLGIGLLWVLVSVVLLRPSRQREVAEDLSEVRAAE